MKRTFIISILIIFFSIGAIRTYAGNANPGINILMIPASIPVNTTGILQVDLGNYGNGSILVNTLRATISIGINAEIIGIDAATSDPRWTVISLTSGTNNTIQLKNTGGSFSSFDFGTVNLTVKGTVVNGASTITANTGYISGSSPALGGAPNTSQGNAIIADDNSTTSLEVITLVPILLSDFRATGLESCRTVLSWRVENMVNFRHFVIEQSADGAIFTVVNTIAGSNASDYQTTVANADGRVRTYYRLKMVDIDGRFTYSPVVSSVSNCGGKEIYIYPNPVSNTLILESVSTDAKEAILYNALGAQVLRQTLHAGQNKMDVSKLVVGVYQLSITTQSGEAKIVKVMVQH